MTTTDWSTWEVGGLGIWYCGDDSSYYNGSVVFRSTALIVVGGIGIWYCGDDSSYFNGSVVFRSTALIVVL